MWMRADDTQQICLSTQCKKADKSGRVVIKRGAYDMVRHAGRTALSMRRRDELTLVSRSTGRCRPSVLFCETVRWPKP